MLFCTWLCGTPVGTESVGAQESGFVVVVGEGSIVVDTKTVPVSDPVDEADVWDVIVGMLEFEELLTVKEILLLEESVAVGEFLVVVEASTLPVEVAVPPVTDPDGCAKSVHDPAHEIP